MPKKRDNKKACVYVCVVKRVKKFLNGLRKYEGEREETKQLWNKGQKKRKDKWSFRLQERRGQEVEGRMQSSDVVVGRVWGSGGGGCEPGIILVAHCLLFSNQLLSSAAP